MYDILANLPFLTERDEFWLENLFAIAYWSSMIAMLACLVAATTITVTQLIRYLLLRPVDKDELFLAPSFALTGLLAAVCAHFTHI